MARTVALLLGVAALVAAVDLAYKARAISEQGAVLAHDRPASYVAGLAALCLAWAGAIVLTRSSSLAVTGGLVLGAGLGNLVSIVLWPSLPGAPDPIVAGDVAFNLADVAAILGLALFVPALVIFAARNRERLFEHL